MIIVMRHNELNDKIANYLATKENELIVYPPIPDLSNSSDSKLTIVDLSADGAIPLCIRGKQFADSLAKKGITSSVKTIDLLVSEVSLFPFYSLRIFAKDLVTTLMEQYQCDVTIRTILNSHYVNTLLVPPNKSKDEKWEVYGIPSSTAYGLTKKKIMFDTFYALSDKRLLWSGNDIDEWLKSEERIVTYKEEAAMPSTKRMKSNH